MATFLVDRPYIDSCLTSLQLPLLNNDHSLLSQRGLCGEVQLIIVFIYTGLKSTAELIKCGCVKTKNIIKLNY